MAKVTPTDMLAAIGIALYGERWHRPLATALGIHARQIRRWITGEYELSPDHELFANALALLRTRRDDISATVVTISFMVRRR